MRFCNSMGAPAAVLEWPNTSNTGVPAGTSLTSSGGLTITTPGTTLDSLDISGTLRIEANNCTVTKCRVTSGDFNSLRCLDGVTGTLIEDCEIDGIDDQPRGIRSASATIRRCYIHNCGDGIDVTGDNVTVEDCYILFKIPGPVGVHSDGVVNDVGAANVTIRHNHIRMGTTDVTACVSLTSDGITNCLVENNLLVGGARTISVGGTGMSGNIIRNNHLGIGAFDYFFISATVAPTVSGNVDWITGAPVSP